MSLTWKKVFRSFLFKRPRKVKLIVASGEDVEKMGEIVSQGPYSIQQSNNTVFRIGTRDVVIMNESGIWLRAGKEDQFTSLESLTEVLGDQGHSKHFATLDELESIKKRNKGEHS